MHIHGDDRRQRLRRATNASHRRLDGLVDRAGLLDSRARYGLFLQASWTARRTAERALEGSGVDDLYAAWPSRRVCDQLSQDVFDVLQSRPAEPAGAALGTLCDAQSLGVLYVLEGSALGAQLVAKRAAAIGMTACFGGRHLAQQTSEPGAWAAFIALLLRTPMTPSEEDRCVTAAAATFEIYERAFATLACSA